MVHITYSDFSKCIFHDVFDDELLHSGKWRPNDAWRARSALSKPHVMFTLVHEYPSVDNKLLRGEVLAILATMLTRLISNEYRDHTVIPVGELSLQTSHVAISLIQPRSWFCRSWEINTPGCSRHTLATKALMSTKAISSLSRIRRLLRSQPRFSYDSWRVNWSETRQSLTPCLWH